MRRVRLLLDPLAIIAVVIGIVRGELLIFGLVGVALFILSFLFYSGRRQRVRYWFQGYRMHLRNNGNDRVAAVKSVQREFCAGKYAAEHICSGDYRDIDTLIRDIIHREFKLERIIQSSHDHQANLLAYKREIEKVDREIAQIKKELGI